ncbi:MAG: DMT family transporter [Firmicutes bacterium]|nr:DMT family transporter [Bacillota bacterium]
MLLIDHFGLFGTLRIPVDWLCFFGVLLLVAGARLIIK